MRLLSWTSLCILSSVLCITCLAGPSGHLDNHQARPILERQKDDPDSAPSTIVDNPVPAATADTTPKKSATPTAKTSDSRRTSAEPKTSAATKTSAAAKKTSAATTKQESTTPTSPTSTPSESTNKVSSDSDLSTSVTPTSSASASIPASSTASTSSTNVSPPTSILEPQPQSANRVSIGGIVAGVVLGSAVLIGIAWIAFAKWRENKRHRAHFGDDEAKHGFADAGANGHHSSSRDSLLAGGNPVRGPNGLKLQSLPLSSRARAHSFGSSYHGSPTSQIPVISPVEAKALPELLEQSRTDHQYSTPLGSHPNIAEMPSPYVGMPPAGLQVGGPVSGNPLPQIHVSSPVHGQRSPSAYQQSPAAELPG